VVLYYDFFGFNVQNHPIIALKRVFFCKNIGLYSKNYYLCKHKTRI